LDNFTDGLVAEALLEEEVVRDRPGSDLKGGGADDVSAGGEKSDRCFGCLVGDGVFFDEDEDAATVGSPNALADINGSSFTPCFAPDTASALEDLAECDDDEDLEPPPAQDPLSRFTSFFTGDM